MNRKEGVRIGFAGLSHLGTTASICSASLGFEVVAFDRNEELIARLKKQDLPIHEPTLDDTLDKYKNQITFTSQAEDLSSCSLVLVCLDTITDSENRSDLTPLRELIGIVMTRLPTGATLVVMSQIPAGFSRQICSGLEQLPNGNTLTFYYWVETLVIGNAVQRFLSPERLITGSKDGGEPKGIFKEYLSRFNAPIVFMNYESAEITKTAINLYLSASVCFANFVSDLCEKYGASMRDIAGALRLDKRIGPSAYIRPGLGIAGGNLERDLVHLRDLAEKASCPDQYVSTMLMLNKGRYRWALSRIEESLKGKGSGTKIAFLGIAYKKDTQSVKNSFAVRVMEELRDGYHICAYDPRAVLPENLRGKVQQESLKEALRGASLAVLITDWDEFGQVLTEENKNLMMAPVLIDCCSMLDARKGRELGFELTIMGEAGF